MSVEYSIVRLKESQGTRREREHKAIISLIKQIFGEEAILRHNDDGSPYIEGCSIHISISHSRNFAALAWSDNSPVGIDIEEDRPKQLERVAERFLTSDEQSCYCVNDESLLEAWTLKEAAYKALRTGPVDLRKYMLPLNRDERHIIAEGKELEIVVSCRPNPELRMALVINSN